VSWYVELSQFSTSYSFNNDSLPLFKQINFRQPTSVDGKLAPSLQPSLHLSSVILISGETMTARW